LVDATGWLRSTRHPDSGTVTVGAAVGVRERGAEAVEFALVVPMFLLLVFGVVDLGYMINHDTMINNASREGAREGALNQNPDDIECRVRRGLATLEPVGVATNCRPTGTPKVTVTITCRTPPPANASCTGTFPFGATSGGTVIVKIDYTHLWITPVGGTIRPGGIPLSKTTEMTIE
jgi:Flp pilus assembly protein TadG